MILIRKIGLITLAIIILIPIAVYAWNDCPYGIINDTFPGQCPRYIDTNNDNLCDHSQSPPQGTTDTGGQITDTSQTGDQVQNAGGKSTDFGKKYYLLPIVIGFTIIYLISFLIYDIGKIKARIYKKMWNMVLTVSFAVAGATGIIMVLMINYGIKLPVTFDILFWHVEFGIVMAVTTVFHLVIYWKSVKRIFSGKFDFTA